MLRFHLFNVLVILQYSPKALPKPFLAVRKVILSYAAKLIILYGNKQMKLSIVIFASC